MDFWLWWIVWWILLLIAEMFVWTFDLLALWIAALMTALLTYVFGIHIQQRHFASIIFLIAAIGAILASRLLVLPKIKGKDGPEPMSWEAVIWATMIAQEVNEKMVVRYEWVYWNIDSAQNIQVWDVVTVLSMHGNHLVVKK